MDTAMVVVLEYRNGFIFVVLFEYNNNYCGDGFV